MFVFVIAILMAGFPVAFGLAGGALLFAAVGYAAGLFDSSFLGAIPARIYGIMTNETLLAVPLFVFMGVVLERGKISEELLEAMGRLFGKIRGGLAVSVCVVGAILAASTGIVGATVVTMGLISLPVMLRHRYRPSFACGVITASGTLGQIIPPSIVLVILGDVISNANQLAQLKMGNFSPEAVSVGDLFFGALLPGLILVGMYIIYVITVAFFCPQWAPAMRDDGGRQASLAELLRVLAPPILLIVAVLGAILIGVATPTESAAVGAGGALVLAMSKKNLDGGIFFCRHATGDTHYLYGIYYLCRRQYLCLGFSRFWRRHGYSRSAFVIARRIVGRFYCGDGVDVCPRVFSGFY